MANKEIITLERIEQDLIQSLKKPQELSESSYKNRSVPSILLGAGLAILSIFNPKIGLYGLFALITVAIVGTIIELSALRHKRKNVCICDYEITTMKLSDTAEEHYVQKGAGVRFRHTRQVNNYTLRFENGKIWNIPKENYTWSKDGPMSDFFIYQNAHRTDLFIVVENKDTGKIAMAYHADHFEYKK